MTVSNSEVRTEVLFISSSMFFGASVVGSPYIRILDAALTSDGSIGMILLPFFVLLVPLCGYQ